MSARSSSRRPASPWMCVTATTRSAMAGSISRRAVTSVLAPVRLRPLDRQLARRDDGLAARELDRRADLELQPAAPGQLPARGSRELELDGLGAADRDREPRAAEGALQGRRGGVARRGLAAARGAGVQRPRAAARGGGEVAVAAHRKRELALAVGPARGSAA